MLQHLIFHFSRHYLSSGRLQEVKNKGKFQTFSSKSGCGGLGEVGCLQQDLNIVIWLGNFWYFGKLVAEERWLLTRGRRNRKFHCNCRSIYNAKTTQHIYLTMTSDDVETSLFNFANLCAEIFPQALLKQLTTTHHSTRQFTLSLTNKAKKTKHEHGKYSTPNTTLVPPRQF